MKLSIIVPVYNNWNFTKTCLKDLAKLPKDHEVILVDNSSIDTTKDILHLDIDKPINLQYIRNKNNFGFAKACNQGFEKAKGECVLFLNNDIKVEKDFDSWTQLLIKEAKTTNGLVGPNGGLLNSALGFVKETTEVVSGNFYMSGWCLCAKKNIFDKLILESNEFRGPFIEEFTTYFEDTDLSFRAEELNIPMKIVSVPVFHFGKMTSKKVGLQELYLSAKVKFINKWAGRK
jgi:GT2 family glycosyltransferase